MIGGNSAIRKSRHHRQWPNDVLGGRQLMGRPEAFKNFSRQHESVALICINVGRAAWR